MLARVVVKKGNREVFKEAYGEGYTETRPDGTVIYVPGVPPIEEIIETVVVETGSRSFQLWYSGQRLRFYRWYPNRAGAEYPAEGKWKWGVKA